MCLSVWDRVCTESLYMVYAHVVYTVKSLYAKEKPHTKASSSSAVQQHKLLLYYTIIGAQIVAGCSDGQSERESARGAISNPHASTLRHMRGRPRTTHHIHSGLSCLDFRLNMYTRREHIHVVPPVMMCVARGAGGSPSYARAPATERQQRRQGGKLYAHARNAPVRLLSRVACAQNCAKCR